MRRFLIGAAAVSALFSVSVTAQQIDEAQATEDMECLYWISAFGISLGLGDATAQEGMAIGIAYFAGHYEATTGRTVADAWDQSAFERVLQNPETYALTCGVRMQRVGLALQALADGMDGSQQQSSRPARK